MAYLNKLIILALTCVLVVTCVSQVVDYPKYTTVRDCNEVCRLHPEAVCKFDCLEVHENGEKNDCINHFYYSDGTMEFHCDWD